MNDRPIFFSHIQKTGGTSLAHMLRRGHPQNEMYPNAAELEQREQPQERVPESESFLALSDKRIAATTLFADHLPPFFSTKLPRTPTLIVMLRDPVERALSHLGHLKRYRPEFIDYSLSALFENRDVRQRLVANFQTRFLITDSQNAPAAALQPQQVKRADLERAIEWLAIADCVGITEAFAQTAQLVAQEIGRDLGPVVRENRADRGIKDGSDDERLRARIADAVGHDRELYEIAVQIFERAAEKIAQPSADGAPLPDQP